MTEILHGPGIRLDETVVGIASLAGCWVHEGEAAELVCDLKYRRITAGISALADSMARIAPVADVVTWVPATPSRRRQRGFDQGELLARAVARRLGLKARRLLRRGDDQAQTGRDLDGRRAGPALLHTGRRPNPGSVVLVVDDVCTTGATLGAAAAALSRAGAGSVVAVVATVARPRDATQSGSLASTI